MMIADRVTAVCGESEALGDPDRARVKTDGLRAESLLEAVSTSHHPAIVSAVTRAAQRTSSLAVLSACVTDAALDSDDGDLLLDRMQELLAVAPQPNGGRPADGAYVLLAKAVRVRPEQAQLLFRQYLSHGSPEARETVLAALQNPPAPVAWAVDMLLPLLDDRSATEWEYGPITARRPLRVCDRVASVIAQHLQGAKFSLEGTHQDLDEQIDAIRSVARRIPG
jgi:hypothetical protein